MPASPTTENWKRADASSYDAQAGAYDRHMERLAGLPAEQLCRLARLTPGQTVLDVACGPGIATRIASRVVGVNGTVIGVDLSRGMVAAAMRRAREDRATNMTFQVMDAEALGFRDAAFDAAICLSAVLHFPNITRALREIHRVVKPGGHVVVSFGSVRPIRPVALAGHLARRVAERLLAPVRPRLRAPDPLIRIVSTRIRIDGPPLNTDWSTADPKAALVAAIRMVGFNEVAASWAGHDVEYDDADEFFEAQAAVCTEVRKRLLHATPEQRKQIETEAKRQSNDVIARGGKLLYAYGAYMVSAQRRA